MGGSAGADHTEVGAGAADLRGRRSQARRRQDSQEPTTRSLLGTAERTRTLHYLKAIGFGHRDFPGHGTSGAGRRVLGRLSAVACLRWGLIVGGGGNLPPHLDHGFR